MTNTLQLRLNRNNTHSDVHIYVCNEHATTCLSCAFLKYRSVETFFIFLYIMHHNVLNTIFKGKSVASLRSY